MSYVVASAAALLVAWLAGNFEHRVPFIKRHPEAILLGAVVVFGAVFIALRSAGFSGGRFGY